MAFNPKNGHLTCDSCGNVRNILDYDSSIKGSTKDSSSKDEPADKDAFESDYYDSNTEDIFIERDNLSNNDVLQYECNNCGAKLIVDKQTTSSSCSFCSSPMILGDKLQQSFAPDLIIPFKIGKSQAQTAFVKWCRKGKLTPRSFMTADRIADIAGIYIPFWLFDLNAKGEIQATCTRVRTYTRGNYIYTETKYYNVYRKVDLSYLKIPCDASKKMDDSLMDKLEPFHYEDLKNFNMPYLAGYVSEKYDYTDRDLLARVKTRAKRFADDFTRSTISGYSSVRINYNNIMVNQKKSYYALLPVWVVYYNYNNKNYIFSMNGQTGKVVGKPPISKAKVFIWFTSMFFSSLIILQIITVLANGGL